MPPCPTGKEQHDYTRAKRLASRASTTHERPMQHYKCRVCGAWHVGGFMPRHKPLPLITSGQHDWRYA